MQKYKAFTLVELLVVLAVIGILSSFIYVQTNNAINSGKDSKRKSDVALLASGIHVYSIGSDLIVSSGCNIGSTCSSQINEALIDQIGPLPSDPDSSKAYIYESDGTDCTISSVLSDGQTYQYDCSDDAMTQSAPVAGACGSCATTYVQGTTSWPSCEFCSGTSISPDPSFPTVDGTSVSWNCPGQYLGSPTTCTAYRALNGSCGTRATTYPYSQSDWTENTYYCSAGTESASPSFPDPGSSANWNCNGISGGINDNDCTASRGSYVSACISGGGLTCTETTDGSYIINTYTYSASPGEYTWTAPEGVTEAEVLIVGGGGAGAGGRLFVGSGGGGGVLYGTLTGLS
ncbi:MAG: prepilin-type N-terminal cleavage/methylation domain-containing protein, partial [Candidatus Pacebacteria bacterium]|nr:prepilin-type N-terminal cleavage/methylation domain-containing protein [Candidatus Paceibacterota bacterium]